MKDYYITELQKEFESVSNSIIATHQKAYLRNQFSFYGIKSRTRRETQKPFLAKQYLPVKENLNALVKVLWQKPQREFHYFAQELVQKYSKAFIKEDIYLLEYMLVTNSWWDTVDFIATNLIGSYFKKFPEQIHPITTKWLTSKNIWLQRSCLIFQLKWKENIDPFFLEQTINKLLKSKEFFINKAIGWILRQYSRTNPDWVIGFVARTPLEPLSKREALKLLAL